MVSVDVIVTITKNVFMVFKVVRCEEKFPVARVVAVFRIEVSGIMDKP